MTGFGLLGHAFEMAQGSDTHLTLFPGEIDLIPEALELARDGILPAEYTFDGIHLKADGYRIWIEKIRPYIK